MFWYWFGWPYEQNNIARHTSWPTPEQWLMIHTCISDLIMTIRWNTSIQKKRVNWTLNSFIYCRTDNWENRLNLRHTLGKIHLTSMLYDQCVYTIGYTVLLVTLDTNSKNGAFINISWRLYQHLTLFFNIYCVKMCQILFESLAKVLLKCVHLTHVFTVHVTRDQYMIPRTFSYSHN